MVLYDINCNVWISSEGAVRLQKSFIFRYFLMGSCLLSVAREWKQFRKYESLLCFDSILLNIAGIFSL